MKANKVISLVLIIILSLVSLLMVYPFIWMVFSSFKTNADIMQNPLGILPQQWVTDGYTTIATMSGNALWHYFKNSMIIAGLTTLIVVFATALGSYALFRNPKLPGFRFIEKTFALSLMYPAVLLLIPLYAMVVKMGLYGTNNFLGIILSSATGAWGAALPYFLFRQFFQSLPYELIEAADIDGASEVQLFTRIIVPVMTPVFTTATLIAFLGNWGLWLPVQMLSKDMSTYNLPAMLVNLNSDLGVDLSQTAALSTIITVPIIILFLFTQRKVMDGIAAGSVKG